MTRDLFDPKLRAARRDRAATIGTDLFLLDRAYDECLDRLETVSRPFGQALLVGCPSPLWTDRLRRVAPDVAVVDPGARFAAASGGATIEEDRFDFGEAEYDLCVAVGTLDTVNDLPLAFQLIRRALRPGALLIGAMAGGNSLPALRSALIESERAEGRAAARTHPRIEAPALGQLLSAAGFATPVVDVDRIRLRYAGLDALVRDLRAMAATQVLAIRPPPLTRAAWHRAEKAFAAGGVDKKTEEIIEILHFIGWNN